ncbi:EAL domain-containing protein [Idiomarina seosinensis]|uniref:EAL domain-containing protein n=1 Tax=Idiomarina seosinensis TaxID=281739 RepID=A0A432ZBE4_9GAMM|nr:EAL domain-containing protein [Idiomarina seosinensis]RUO75258.1 hypothetical protein CWI81_09770 [Idiomarina seosinensis]
MAAPDDPYSFAAWCRESLVDFTKLNAEKQVFIGFLLAIFIAAMVRVIEVTGGIPSVYEHLIYLPLFFSGLLLGPRIGALGGFVCGLALSPLSFSSQLIAENEIAVGWLIRLLILILVPTIAGLITNSVRELVALEKKAKHTYHGTELPNIEALKEQLRTIGEEEDSSTDDLVDIFNFKLQNLERIQHQIGTERTEKLMRQLAEKLRKAIGDSAHIGQTSQNELVGVSTDAKQSHKELEKKISSLLERPIVIDGVPYQLDSATGVLRVKKGALKEQEDQIVEQAQQHAFEAREKKQNFAFLEPDDAIANLAEASFSRQLTEALERNDIKLYYQPRLNANSGYFSVLEGIVKWTDPKRGDMDPDEFRPLIEEADLTKQFTSWMVKKAFEDIKNWHQNNFVVRVSLHITLNDVIEPSVLNAVAHELHESKFPPRNFSLEVSERSLMRISDKAKRYLEKLRSIGVNIIADHFGDGAATIQSLFVLPVDAVKLSEELVKKATSNSDKKRALTSMVKMARSRGLKTIATGIDDRSKLLLLKQIGCEELQGSILSKPQPKDDIPWARIR